MKAPHHAPPLPAQTSPSLNANKKSASNFDNSHHTYHSILRILCEAFQIDYEGGNHKCERQLIDEAHRLNRQGKILAPVIVDAHY